MDDGRDRTVLLVSSDRLACTALRQILVAERPWHLLADVREIETAPAMAAETQPDMLLVAAEASGADLVRLVGELRARCPTAKIVVVGDLLTSEEHRFLAEQHVTAYLLWHTLTAKQAPTLLTLIVEGDISLASREVVERLFLEESDQSLVQEPTVQLTEPEHVVLQAMARGWSQRQIARETHLCRATVERAMASLRLRLGASSSFTLAMRATEAGLLP